MSKEIKGKVIGIDLGTTNSCVAILSGGKFQVIPNLEGHNTTPSVVAYKSKTERITGARAVRQAITNPGNTLYRTKSFIGITYEEALNKTKDHPLPFDIIKSKTGGVEFKLSVGVNVSPAEAGAAILQDLVKSAEKYLGEKIVNVVITTPAYFSDSQRQATKDAGEIAGLNVLRIVNEPTAAALAYGLDKAGNEKIAVYDLGGGTFDISILDIEDGVFKVMSTNGNTNLGGEDFDQKIIKYIAKQFKSDSGIDLLLENNKEVLQRLKEAAEKAKIELSSATMTDINLPFITANETGAKHLNVSITKAQFESLIADFLKETEKCCSIAIKDSGLKVEEINKVLLVGGSTRIPAVQELVERIFKKKPSCDLNPDEVVAMGAAVQGGILGGDVKDVLLLDVIPLSLGIETLGGVMTKLIEKNSTIPTRKTQVFSTAADNQTAVDINIFQGEREMASGNKKLGNFILSGIPAAPRGVPQVEVAFDVDANGILNVSAKEKNTGKEQSITITGASGLSKEEIERMTKDAEQHSEEDRKQKEKIEVINHSDSLIYTSEKSLKESGDKLPEDLKTSIQGKIKTLQDKRNNSESETSEIQSAYDELSSEISKIYEFMNKNASAEGSKSEEPKSEEPIIE